MTADGPMSKVEILRGLVTDRLSTAVREILAAVERTVAGYEEEATGLRKEVDRQRRQLEAVLQPRVTLERTGFIPDVKSCDAAVDVNNEEETQTQQTDPEVLVLLGDGGEDLMERQRRAVTDPDYQTTSNRSSSKPGSVRKKRGQPRIGRKPDGIQLRICVLEDSHSDVLTAAVFQKCPVQDLRFPPGLQEVDFLSLLRSAFPQLDAPKPLDVFTADTSRRLRPLTVQTLTPEEISSCAGGSALYIRLRTPGDEQSSIAESQERQDQQSGPSSRVSSPKRLPQKKRRVCPPLAESSDHYKLKLCFLSWHPLSNKVLVKSAVQQLRCPQRLQESDFLLMLRSRFPQLDGDDRGFDLFTADKNSKLTPVPVKTLTPEAICRSLKPYKSRPSIIYIRLKTSDEDQEELYVSRITDPSVGSPSAAAPTVSDEAELCSSKSPSRQEDMSAERLEKDPGLYDRTDEVVSQSHSDSDDDDGDDGVETNKRTRDDTTDWTPKSELQTLKNKRVQTSGEAVKTPCKVCDVTYKRQGSLIRHAWNHADETPSLCGVCGELFTCAEDLKTHLKNCHKTHECSLCGKSFVTVNGLKSHVISHSGELPYKCDVCSKTFSSVSRLTVHHWVHVAEKPHKCNVCNKGFSSKAQLRAHSRIHMVQDGFQCNICGKTLGDRRSLTRHKTIHSSERPFGCQTCGKHFKNADALKSHKRVHTVRDQRYLCDICCKTFTTSALLRAHLKRHGSDRPFVCHVCSKGFVSKSGLTIHLRVHTGEAPYGCTHCGRHFKSRSHLACHVRSHLGIKLYTCTVCGKACSRTQHLKIHMRTHNGERPYKCSVCDRAFTQSHCLKTHMKSHREHTLDLSDAKITG